MKNRLFLTAGLSSLLMTACVTAPTVPEKRPMTPQAQSQMKSPDVNLAENQRGVGATWFRTQTNGAGAGLIGVVGAAIADAIINAAPSSRANKTANEVAENIVAADLNTSLVNALEASKNDGLGAVSLNTVSLVNTYNKDLSHDGKLYMYVTYQLAEDGSAFKAVANAKYENADIPYVSPYTFEEKVPKSQIGGPLYKNSFTFNSSQFDQPTLTEALKAELVTSVEESFRDEGGNLPTEGTEFKKMQKGVEKAKDDKLTKSETSLFLVQNWLKNGGAPMKLELEQAHNFFAKYLIADLNSVDIPSLAGTDTIIETLPSGRVVKMVGQGMAAGSYISEPGNVTGFTTYGNAVNYPKIGKEAASAAKKAASNR